MKLKRFLAIVISLAMVLSIVPAFSLTVGAASDITDDGLLTYAKSTTALFDLSSANINWSQSGWNWDTEIESGMSNYSWTLTKNSTGYTNMACGGTGTNGKIQHYYSGKPQWAGGNPADIVTMGSGFGADSDWTLFSFTPEFSIQYGNAALYDVEGNIITAFRIGNDSQLNINWGHNGWGTPYSFSNTFTITPINTSNATQSDDGTWKYNVTSGSSKIDILFRNNDSNYTATYYIDGGAIATVTYDAATFNGIGGLGLNITHTDGTYQNIAFSKFSIYAGNYPASTVEVTAKYTIGGNTVNTVTKTYDTTTETYASFDAYYYSVNGTNTLYKADAQTLSESTTIEMTALANYSEYAVGNQFQNGDQWYEVTGTNLIPNSNFAYGINGWYTGAGTAAASSNFTTDASAGSVVPTGNGGSGAETTLQRSWAIESGETYAFIYTQSQTSTDRKWQRFCLGNDFNNNSDAMLLGAGASDVETGQSVAVGKNIVTFTNTEGYKYANFRASYSGGVTFSDFALYKVKAIDSYTITLNIKGTDGSIVKTLTNTGLEGNTVTFDAQSFTANGVFYTTEAQSYTVGTADATYEITATADTSKIATTNDFSYNFNTGAVIWAGDHGFNSADKTGTISIGWGNFRQTVMTFPLPDHSGELISAIDLNIQVGYTNNSTANCEVYAIDPSLVGDGTMDPQITGYADTNVPAGIAALNGIKIGSATVANGSNTITLDLSDAGAYTENELALILICQDGHQVYTYSATTAYPPYLSSTYTTISSITYTVNYVDERSNTIKASTTVDYAPGAQYGYNNEVICPNLAIPTIEGYIFKSKSVSDTTVTLTYAQDTQDDYFFDNITNMNTRFVSLNMLGAHDAFTDGMDKIRYDAAGVAMGDDGSKNASLIVGGIAATALSKTQDLTPLGQLKAGARYFDVRLTRSETDAIAGSSFLYNNAPHTNGVLYTTHGALGEEFEPALYSISQWAATHPGEIIVLDFQEYFDYNSGYDGNATAQSWRDLNTMLTKTGIMNYVTIGNQSLKNVTYGQLTENGKKCGIVLFGRSVATSAGVGSFNLRGDTSGAFNGRVYSNYKTGLSTTIGSSYNENYIQAQVDYAETYQSVTGDTNGDNIIHWMFRVLQGQSESKSNLLNQASSDNTNLYNGLVDNPSWLTALPVVMVNRVGTNTDNIVALLKECNVPTETVNYVYNGTTVKSVPNAALVGTLYTNDGFYDEPVYKLVAGTDGEYYVTETFYTAPSKGTETKVVKGSAVEVDVTKLGNVYTIQHDDSAVSNVVKVYSGGIDNFSAFFWGGGNTDHRTGVAIVDATDSSAYTLTATQFRDAVYDGSNTVSFYVVSYEDFLNVDLTDYAAFKALLTDTNKAAYFTSKTYDDSTEKSYETVLDANVVKNAIGESGKVVIIGDSLGGLYGLKNDISIVSCYVVESTTEGVTTTTVVKPGGTYALGTAKVYVDASNNNLYAPGSSVTVNSDMTFNGYNTLGADVVNGAQVRIGAGVDANGKVSTGSGLRFITKVNTVDKIAGLANITEIGVRITAEGSGAHTDIATADDKWQTATVFTSALTNLKESNYNRNFTATPYVKYTDTATGDEVVVLADTSVTRSIYQVARGLLAKGYDGNYGESEDKNEENKTDYTTMPEVLVKVLNAYVNQTGIRLQINSEKTGLEIYNKDGSTSNYSGDVFFKVVSTDCVNNVYTITIQPVGDNTTINSYWQDYIRINNNNSAIKSYTSLVDNDDNTVTITFDYAKYLADKATSAE